MHKKNFKALPQQLYVVLKLLFTLYFVDYCCLVYYKQLLGAVFVISRIMKVEVSVIS